MFQSLFGFSSSSDSLFDKILHHFHVTEAFIGIDIQDKQRNSSFGQATWVKNTASNSNIFRPPLGSVK